MSAEDEADPGPSGLDSSDSSHSGTYPWLALEDIQQITGVVAGILCGSSASPLSLPPTSSTTTTDSHDNGQHSFTCRYNANNYSHSKLSHSHTPVIP